MRKVCSFAVGLLVFAAGVVAAPAGSGLRFNRDIRPILSENCFACHGPDSAHRKAGLRLDRTDGLFGRHEHGFAVVPGKPAESLLYTHVTASDPEERMPPVKSGKKLTEAEQRLLTRWIEEGAQWEPLWSFVAPVRGEPPAVKDKAWCHNPIDRFVLARLEAEGLSPNPEADRRALIRRVTFDLTGLPPTPPEVDAFVSDTSPNAYEKVVDRLLASPRYGEHEARYWLDAARYGDTHGIHIDNYREIWPYRDWVIAAFNRNEPFDQFTIDQLAGDLLAHPSLEQQVATGFNRCNITTSEGGSIPEEVAVMYAKDRVETTSAVWLGLTTGCAVCHDHKFDPIAQKEFYQLTAFFRNTTQKPLDGNVKDTPPNLVVPRPEERAKWEQLAGELKNVEDARKKLQAQAGKPFAAWLKGPEAKSLHQPLDPKDERLVVGLDDGTGKKVAAWADGKERSLDLPENFKWGKGPLKDKSAALEFGPRASLTVPDAGDLDADKPFSLGGWVYLPKQEGSYVVASKFDDKAKGQKPGWVLEVDNRLPSFRLVGTSPGQSLQVRANNSLRLKGGTWAHVFVTYDGSGSHDGLTLFVDGKPQYGEEVDEKTLKESTRNAGPLRLGSDGKRDLHGGALQDFRIYARELNEEEVAVVFRWNELRAALARPDGKMTGPERADLQQLYLLRYDEPYRKTVDRQSDVEQAQRVIRRHSPITLVMLEKPNSEPTAHVLFRGQYDQPKEEVHAETPAFLPPMTADQPHNRLGLARWLVDPANPLTARVVINRYWQQLFGEGLVRTPGDFGIMGENPTHPLLLDWLACEFRDGSTSSPQVGSTGLPQVGSTGLPQVGSTGSTQVGSTGAHAWDVKHMLKLMVMSAAYRQSAVTTAEKLQKDPDNRLLSRGPRYRLDAEELRDAALAASGLLVEKIGGPSVRPYQPPGVWEAVAMFGSNTRFYKPDTGENLYRRSLYTFWKRSAPPASMDIFNAPSRETCVVKRERTDTPLQALVAMNDPQWVEAARVLATRALRESPPATDSRLDFITTRVIARPLEPSEREICRRSLQDFADLYRAHPEEAKKLIATGDSKPDVSLPPAELATWALLASQIMNLDEALNK